MRQHTDQMLARYQPARSRDSRSSSTASSRPPRTSSRDLTEQEMELVTRARDRIQIVNQNMGPLEEAREIATDSRRSGSPRSAKFMGERRQKPHRGGVPLRRRLRARLLAGRARRRATRSSGSSCTTAPPPTRPPPTTPACCRSRSWGRSSTSSTTARPLVSAFGPRQLPSGSWSRPKVTQHTNVAAQSAEKTELDSARR